MTPLGLLAMRKAAALAFALPGMELDVVHQGEIGGWASGSCRRASP